MVNHGRFVLTEEKKTEMEEGGGTKESTKAIRKAIGANFVQYVADREAMWCGDSSQAPNWWTPPGGLGAPRTVEELATLDNCCLMGYYARDWLWEAQVSRKNSEGVLVDDYPMFHTAAALRSHMKNYLLETFKVNLADPITFPKWNDWWKAYKGEVLKPNGKMKVENRQHLPPDFMESVMDLLALAEAVYAARGTEHYPALLALLPEGCRDNYHKLIQKGGQYVVTLFLAQRAVESIQEMNVGDLVKEEDDTLEFSYWREACRGRSKNHYADLESAHNGGVIPDLMLTNSTYKFNPCSILETYLGMRNKEGLPRLMMKPLTSVTYKKHGCKPVAGKFNLHNPETTICFSDKLVIGKNMVAHMCEDLAGIMGQPKCTNSQLRSTAIQALRMAEFELEDIQKVSRHARKETITKHYDPGQRTSTRANMAVAIGQAAAMRRGEVFQPVAQALVRKVSKARVEMATPAQMLPKRSSCLRLVDTSTSTLLQGNSNAFSASTLFQGGRVAPSLNAVATDTTDSQGGIKTSSDATLAQGGSTITPDLLQGDRSGREDSTLLQVQGGRDASNTLTLYQDTSSSLSMAVGSSHFTQGSSAVLGTIQMAAGSTTHGGDVCVSHGPSTFSQGGRIASSLDARAAGTFGPSNLTQGSSSVLATTQMPASSTTLGRHVGGLSPSTLSKGGMDTYSLNAVAADTWGGLGLSTHSKGGMDTYTCSLNPVAASVTPAPLSPFRTEGDSSVKMSKCRNLLMFSSNAEVDQVQQLSRDLKELEKRRSLETAAHVDPKANTDWKKPTVVSHLDGGKCEAEAAITTSKTSTLYDELWKFKKAEGLTEKDGDMMAFKRLLWKEGIEKVVISGFKNGKEGHVTLPPSLLGSTEDSQLLFVKCKSNGNPVITEKLVMARSSGLKIADGKFLRVWAACGCIPATLEEYPVTSEWGARANKREVLRPVTTPIFGGQNFCFVNTEGWSLSTSTLAGAITRLGGTVVTKEEREQVVGPVFSLSSVEVEGEEELYRYDWVVQMIVAGRTLRREHYLVDREEDQMAASQAVINVTKSLETPKPSTMASTTQPVPLQPSPVVSHLSAKRAAVMLPPYLGTNQGTDFTAPPFGYPLQTSPYFHIGQGPPGHSTPYTLGFAPPYSPGYPALHPPYYGTLPPGYFPPYSGYSSPAPDAAKEPGV